MWMEGIVAPPDVDRDIYRVALGGAGTEEPYWRGGDLHEYGAWWLIAQLERTHAGFVRRLLALAAWPRRRRSARPAAGWRAPPAAGARWKPRSRPSRAVRSTILSSARRCGPGSTARLGAGGHLVLRAHVEPLSLRLWKRARCGGRRHVAAHGCAAPASDRAAGLRASSRSGVGALRLAGGLGPLQILVIGGAGGAQDIRLALGAPG